MTINLIARQDTLRDQAVKIPSDVAATIIDPRAYAAGKPVDDAFAWLRKEAPLAVAEPDGYDPFWVVTRHADILDVERQNELFHNGDRSATLTTIEGDRKVRVCKKCGTTLDK